MAVSEVAGVGILLDHQMPGISRDTPALLWLHAHSALAHGDIIQSHCGILAALGAGWASAVDPPAATPDVCDAGSG